MTDIFRVVRRLKGSDEPFQPLKGKEYWALKTARVERTRLQNINDKWSLFGGQDREYVVQQGAIDWGPYDL